jgi:NAD(P)-dependent dehydrogenase (short-subunit alcohol dehydrogenase family)
VELHNKVVVVTGGASGIGAALCRRFAAEGAAGIAVGDIDAEGCARMSEELAAGGTSAVGVPTDVAREGDMAALVERAEAVLGPVDLFCSNAGIAIAGGFEVPSEDWQRIWEVNLMSHVYAARVVVPRMEGRGGGHLLITASAAGLLTNLGSAPYSVTKHAAVALAEWLAITHAAAGIAVSCLCPQGVRTPMLLRGLEQGERAGTAVLASGEMIEPEAVASAVVAALAEERFLILPHAEVATYMRNRADDPERWLRGMRRLWSRLEGGA